MKLKFASVLFIMFLACGTTSNITSILNPTIADLIPVEKINDVTTAQSALIIAEDFRVEMVVKVKKSGNAEAINNARRFDDDFRGVWKGLKATVDSWKATGSKPSNFNAQYNLLVADAGYLNQYAGGK